MACVQLEEAERIRKFMFSRDAKSALVRECHTRAVFLLEWQHLGRQTAHQGCVSASVRDA